jgi:GT2 family glycosyltransferase
MLTAAYVEAARWKRVMADPPSIPVKPKRIYSTHGSLMIFHNRFFERGGTLEYGGFLYGEEIHVAEQVRQMGLDILWTPSLQAYHQGGATMEMVSIDQRRQWWKESYEFLYQTYFRAG